MNSNESDDHLPSVTSEQNLQNPSGQDGAPHHFFNFRVLNPEGVFFVQQVIQLQEMESSVLKEKMRKFSTVLPRHRRSLNSWQSWRKGRSPGQLAGTKQSSAPSERRSGAGPREERLQKASGRVQPSRFAAASGWRREGVASCPDLEGGPVLGKISTVPKGKYNCETIFAFCLYSTTTVRVQCFLKRLFWWCEHIGKFAM